MTDRNKCSSNREMSQKGASLPGNSGKNGNCGFDSRNCGVHPGKQTARANGMEQKIPRELMLIAALRGGGDPNETIYQGRLDRRGACRLGDGRVRDAARSRKRDYHRWQRRRRAGQGRTRPWPRSYGPRRPRSSLWMGPRTRSSSSSPSLIPPQESTFGDLLRFVPTKVPRCLGS